MDFEWDEAKSEWNRVHRGFGFEVVYEFDWENSVTRISSRGDELRFFSIALHELGPLTIIWTPRPSGTRIISVRRAHQKEAKKYGYDQT
jgi:uncharacterized DUF497 family protein